MSGVSGARFTVDDARVADLDAVVLADAAEGSRVTVVPSRGGLVTSLFARGREWLYLDEATLRDPTQNVRGGAPVLFPSPGKLQDERYAFGGHERAMKQHGFARRCAFREVSRHGGPSGQAQVELELTDSEATRAEYPWPFRLRILYALRGAQLTLTATVTNTGAEAMPFALGYHPYFAVPDAAKAECRVPTKSKRAWDNVRREERDLGSIDLASGEVDLHLAELTSGAELLAPWGRVALGGHLRHWVVWTLPGRDFVCLEPWSAPRDALNTGAGLEVLAPGASRRLAVTLSVG